jgi:hypothetical protein
VTLFHLESINVVVSDPRLAPSPVHTSSPTSMTTQAAQAASAKAGGDGRAVAQGLRRFEQPHSDLDPSGLRRRWSRKGYPGIGVAFRTPKA